MRRRIFWTPLSLWNCSSSSNDEGSGRPDTGLAILLIGMWVDSCESVVMMRGGSGSGLVVNYDDIDFFWVTAFVVEHHRTLACACVV